LHRTHRTHNTGDTTIRTEVQAIVEHVLSVRPGKRRVSIFGSRTKEDWEGGMRSRKCSFHDRSISEAVSTYPTVYDAKYSMSRPS
jgi:hypothetical protein